jgi:serine/threonine protein kinase
VKLLHPHLAAAARREAVARFFDEARTTAALRHPTIVAILDLDETQRRLVMELCAGGTLRARLQRGPLPVEAALLRHVEVLSALDAAHRRGVVHRDLKPANLLFRGDPDSLAGELVLCDFGVAHLSDAMIGAAAGAAPPGAAARKQLEGPVGTVLYMPPEQRIGAPASPRGDVFAAGLILHETLTGRLAWNRADALKGTLHEEALALPRSIGAPPDVPAEIEQHLRRLTAAAPEARVSCDEALTSARNLLDLVRSSSDEALFAADHAAVFGTRP